MTFFVNVLGDKQPDQVKVHLPSCFNERSVYERKKNEMEEMGEDCVSLQHFYWFWKENFPHFIIPGINFCLTNIFSSYPIMCNIQSCYVTTTECYHDFLHLYLCFACSVLAMLIQMFTYYQTLHYLLHPRKKSNKHACGDCSWFTTYEYRQIPFWNI